MPPVPLPGDHAGGTPRLGPTGPRPGHPAQPPPRLRRPDCAPGAAPRPGPARAAFRGCPWGPFQAVPRPRLRPCTGAGPFRGCARPLRWLIPHPAPSRNRGKPPDPRRTRPGRTVVREVAQEFPGRRPGPGPSGSRPTTLAGPGGAGGWPPALAGPTGSASRPGPRRARAPALGPRLGGVPGAAPRPVPGYGSAPRSGPLGRLIPSPRPFPKPGASPRTPAGLGRVGAPAGPGGAEPRRGGLGRNCGRWLVSALSHRIRYATPSRGGGAGPRARGR